MSNVLRLTRTGTPARLAENVLDLADAIELMVVAFVEKDGTIRTEWTQGTSNLQMLGLVEALRAALLEQIL